MKILIHASLDFKDEMVSAKQWFLENTDCDIILPELTRYQHIRDVEGRYDEFNAIKNKLTLENFNNVEKCDALLILNYDHRGYKNYVGGNAFMEMVLAYYLKKPIYLLNDIPEYMSYTEEIKSFYPIIIRTLSFFKKK